MNKVNQTYLQTINQLEQKNQEVKENLAAQIEAAETKVNGLAESLENAIAESDPSIYKKGLNDKAEAEQELLVLKTLMLKANEEPLITKEVYESGLIKIKAEAIASIEKKEKTAAEHFKAIIDIAREVREELTETNQVLSDWQKKAYKEKDMYEHGHYMHRNVQELKKYDLISIINSVIDRTDFKNILSMIGDSKEC